MYTSHFITSFYTHACTLPFSLRSNAHHQRWPSRGRLGGSSAPRPGRLTPAPLELHHMHMHMPTARHAPQSHMHAQYPFPQELFPPPAPAKQRAPKEELSTATWAPGACTPAAATLQHCSRAPLMLGARMCCTTTRAACLCPQASSLRQHPRRTAARAARTARTRHAARTART